MNCGKCGAPVQLTDKFCGNCGTPVGNKYCTGCGAHSVLQGSKDCPLGDDMDGILERMQAADAFIFGTPNHGRTTRPLSIRSRITGSACSIVIE